MKAFIMIDTVKSIGDEYKAVTQSGTEIYVKKDELIPYVRFPEGSDESFGFVKVNGKLLQQIRLKSLSLSAYKPFKRSELCLYGV